ncbi:MAG: aminopeptidase P family protein, partial [Rhodospirillaceae bacterium]|nr:aminopeptidase P family protein [Rhodospirillaceae bacterium]
DDLRARLEAGGATVEDHSFLVEELRFVKSRAEIAVVRRTAAIADNAMEEARDAIAEGVMETELEGIIMASMMKSGGGYPGIRTMLGSGPRAGTHHSPPQHRRIRQGDLIFVDFCGCLHRYHVNVNRTFSLGEPDPRWTTLMDNSAGCVDAVTGGVKVGDPLSKVQEVADAYTDKVGLRDYVWFVGGYSLGIAMPPDWCGSHWVAPRENLGDRVITPGQVFNLENQFDVWEDWPGGSGAAWIDSFLVTENGLEVLSRLPRNLVVV